MSHRLHHFRGVRALDRKLIRDLLHMKSQVLAISLVIGCGVAAFVMSLTALDSLTRSQQTYYDRYRFADVFAHATRAPREIENRIAAIPGVARVETRIVSEVTLDVEGMAEPAVGRLISLPDYREPNLNAVHLRSGRHIEPGREGEVLASEAFAEAHDLHPGDSILAVMNGRREELKIVGIALSPEYVIQVQGGSVFPDDERFGVFWMGQRQMEAAFDMEGAFNDVALTLMRGASEKEVLRRLDDVTRPYGGLGAYGRIDQVSHRFLSDEIKGLRGMARIAPTIFLGVAAFLLNVVLSRLINTQREEIAALKAFGYTPGEVGTHYLKFALLIVFVGVAIGIAGGVWLGRNITELYTRFYRFPYSAFEIGARPLILALAVSTLAGCVGVIGAVRRAVKLPPAEAMRPEPPTAYHRTRIRDRGLARLFSAALRMILRHLGRRPVKAAFSVLGIALAVAIMVIGMYMEDSLNHVTDFTFYKLQRQDITLTFVEPATHRAFHEVGNLPGVHHAEPFRAVAVRVHAGHRSRKLGIMGLRDGADLNRVLDKHARPVRLPQEGIVLSSKLGEVLQARPGDIIEVEVLEGRRPTLSIPVADIMEDFMGLGAYMHIDTLNRAMKEGRTVSGAFLSVDSAALDRLYPILKTMPGVAGVNITTAALKSFEETLAENLLIMRFFNILFGSIIAFGVVYNSARISLSERGRELATLRVIGFTRAEISMLFLGELAILTLLAIPFGLALGYLFAFLTNPFYDTELYRFPLIIKSPTYAFAATTILVAAILSGLIVRHRLDHLDLTAVLKSGD